MEKKKKTKNSTVKFKELPMRFNMGRLSYEADFKALEKLVKKLKSKPKKDGKNSKN